MKCDSCNNTLEIPGRIVGYWQCFLCVEKKRQQRRKNHEDALARLRERHAAEKCLAHVPSKVLPPTATDDEAQAACDESLACFWRREKDFLGEAKVVCWGEM